MDLKNLEEIKERLEKEYNENCLKIDDLNEKIRVLNANDFETNVSCAFGFSLIPLFVFTFLIPPVIKFGIIPLNIVPPLFVGVPALIGITGEKLLSKKYKCREKLKEFSKSKTQKERIEETIKYEIKKEKLNSINKVLKKNCDDLAANKNLISSLSTSYNITEKDVDKRNKEEIENNINNLNNIMQKKQQDIDVATTKCVLKEKFWKVRDKFNRFSDILRYGVIGGFFCMTLYDMPIIYASIAQLQNIQFQISLIGVYAPAIIGGLAGGVYGVKKRNNHTAVFKTINSELGDNAISESRRDYEEDKQLNIELENIINYTCEIKLKLETEKQKLKI